MDPCTQGPRGWLRGTLKFMKGLVRQRARAEGSMMEGYMVYQNMLYVCEYLPNLSSNLN